MIRCTLYFLILLIGVVYGASEVHEQTYGRSIESEDLTSQGTGIDYMKQFGVLNMLANHPMFTNLGLTPQQNLGVMTALLSTGLLNPNNFKTTNPFVNGFRPANIPNLQNQQNLQSFQPFPISPTPFPTPNFPVASNLFNPNSQLDPYFLLLLSHYAKYLPYGLGAQGIYGSSGLPKTKPLGIVKYSDKN